MQLHKRGNVERGGEELSAKPAMTLNTYRLKLEIPVLVTAERMGLGLPVLLVVADIERDKCCFVCLNDYVDKILGVYPLSIRCRRSASIRLQNRGKVEPNILVLRWRYFMAVFELLRLSLSVPTVGPLLEDRDRDEPQISREEFLRGLFSEKREFSTVVVCSRTPQARQTLQRI